MPRRGNGSSCGQAMLETLLALLFLGFVFLLAFDYSEALRARTCLDHAAARGARARAVGFNDFMVTKTVRLAMMPVSGTCLTAQGEGRAPTADYLVSRSGSYLETQNPGETRGILDFEHWDETDLSWYALESGTSEQGDVTVGVTQHRPVTGFVRDGEGETLTSQHGSARTERHYAFYLQ